MFCLSSPLFSHFERQIELAKLPFPNLSFFTGQTGLIVVGSMLLRLAFSWKKWNPQVASKAFLLANVMVIPIFSFAIDGHHHPDVPAEILPFESELPLMAICLIVMAILNMYLFKESKREVLWKME